MITEEIQALGFECLGGIKYDETKHLIRYELEDRDDFIYALGCVYMWVRLSPDARKHSEIVYIGRSASNIYHRRAQWQSGMNAGHKLRLRDNQLQGDVAGKGKGLEMRRKIYHAINAGDTVAVWARVSARQTLFGRSTSLSASEEEALISIYNPPWNGYIRTY